VQLLYTDPEVPGMPGVVARGASLLVGAVVRDPSCRSREVVIRANGDSLEAASIGRGVFQAATRAPEGGDLLLLHAESDEECTPDSWIAALE
jgi:hypothetical protein